MGRFSAVRDCFCRGMLLVLTPSNLIWVLGMWLGFLLTSQYFDWFWFNRAKGVASAMAVGSLLIVLLALFFWMGAATALRFPCHLTLRSIFGLVVLTGVLATWVAYERHESYAEEKSIEALGSSATVILEDYGRNFSCVSALPWFDSLIGRHYFRRVSGVNVDRRGSRFVPPNHSYDDLERIRGFSHLKTLGLLSITLTERGTHRLSELRELEYLAIELNENSVSVRRNAGLRGMVAWGG